MRIVVDAMGSDTNPEPDVAGAVEAARAAPDTIILVGDEARIKAELAKHQTAGLPLEIVHATDVISMTDKPSQVVKGKPGSSVHVGLNLVKDGQADAFVSAGNTGAVLAVALLATIRRIRGVERPALSAIIRFGTQTAVLLDVGANADCRPEWLAQFALMGSLYAQNSLKLDRPRIGLLSNGEEEGKGNQLVHEAHDLLKSLPINYVGNIEPKQFLKGAADVVVADGFVGNIMLKSLEAGTSKMASVIRDELRSSVLSKIGAALALPAFRRVFRQVDPAEVGGAPLLGVNGVVIIGHGSSNAKAIKNAVGQARSAVQGNVIQAIRDGLAQTQIPAAAPSSVEQQ